MQSIDTINSSVANALNSPEIKANITNTVTLVTCGLTLFYAMYFWFFLEKPTATLINLLFVVSYSFTFLFTYKHFKKTAKIWFFSVFILHIVILTTQVFSSSVGFHYFLLILPSGVFLLFDENEQVERILIFFLGLIAFFICDSYENFNPLVTLPAELERAVFVISILIVMLENFFVMFVFSLDISRHQAELKEMATKDVLTGINNRRTFMLVGDELIAHAKRYNKQLSLILFDIDFFKKINDKHGHLVGDEALKEVAQVLKNNIRASDIIARYGGEEFVVLLPETDINAAKILADSLREQVASIIIPLQSNHQNSQIDLRCTISGGISCCSINADSLQALVKQADIALYQAKDAGRNCTVSHHLVK
ncbi:MAG: GGDEF domain-containing protein [Colwellia sp.]|nr:GGDEF domain-containing protein [Colwellia sp.]